MSKVPKKKAQKISEDEEIGSLKQQRRLRYLKDRRNIRRLEISIARTRAMARFISILILMYLIVRLVNLPQWYINANIFANYPNSFLEIRGNEIVTNKQIMKQLAGIKLPDKPVYLLNTKIIEKSLMKLTPIKKVTIRRFWFPGKLQLLIDEKIPKISISPAPAVPPIAVFMDDMSIIDREYLPLPAFKKVYAILTYDDYSKWSLMQVNGLIALSELIEGVTGKKLVYLDIRNPDDVFAQLNDIKLRLGGLDRSIFKRTQKVGAMLSKALEFKNDIDYIDLRWDKAISIKLKSRDDSKNSKENKDKTKID